MPKLIRFLIAATCAMLLLLAACGGDDDDSSDGTTTATVTGDDDDSADDPIASATEGGSDDDGEGSDYYTQLADLVNNADDQIDDIATEFGGPYSDDQDEIDDTRSAIAQTGRVVETVAIEIADLDPPADARSAHDEYVDSLHAVLITYADLSLDLEGVSTKEDLNEVIDQYTGPVQNNNQLVEDVCQDLQDLSDAAGSGADLTCTE